MDKIYEQSLGNVNIRAKRKKKPLELGVMPVAAEVYRGKIDKIPEMELNVTTPELIVEGKDMRKPLNIGLSRIESAIDDSKAREIPAYIEEPKPIGGYDDQYKEAFAQAVTPSNEIDYTQSNADKVINDYKDEELVNVVNSIKPQEVKAPVVDEDVPIIDSTQEYEAPTKEMVRFEEEKAKKAEEQKLSDWQDEYVKSIWSEEDEKEAEKKKKAAQWVTAAQMLGDSLTALGNSYFTAKGANNMGASQGASKAAEATSKLHEDIRNARERAAKTKYELDKARKEWEYRVEQDKLARQERKDAAARAQANADRLFEYNKGKDAQSRLDTQAQREIENARADKILKIQEKNAESTAKRADAYANRQAWLNAGGGASKNWETPISIKDENGKDVVGYINTKGLTETNLQQIADTLPDDVKEKYGLTGEVWRDSQVLGTFDDKVARAIGEVIQDTNSETYKYMERLGLIEVGAMVPSSDKTEGGGKSLGLKQVNG